MYAYNLLQKNGEAQPQKICGHTLLKGMIEDSETYLDIFSLHYISLLGITGS